VASEPTVGDMMAAYAEDAVDHAKRNGVVLDYTMASVKDVETLLGVLYAAAPRGVLARLLKRGPSTEDVATAAKMYGGYVGEVIRRTRGGEWVLDTEISPGQTVISLRDGEWRTFPPAKVHKRLVNGPEDNVWHYFQVLMNER
jgi:hypothetical protein